MPFGALPAAAANELSYGGTPLAQLRGESLLKAARTAGLPRTLSDEDQMRVLLGVLLRAADAVSGAPATVAPAGAWKELREEAAGLLLLCVRREGGLSEATAAALNVLNKPQVVEKVTTKGNRWTIAEACRDPTVERARTELGGDGPGSTGEWLRSLGDALDAPVEERPWYKSTMVLFVLFLAALFVLVHMLLLGRVLMKVRALRAHTRNMGRSG